MKFSKFAGLILAGAMFALMVVSATAHTPDEASLTGKAAESCLEPGESWSVTWTLANDPNVNPFGVIDADTSDGQDVLFDPLEQDVGDGYVPDGDEATATTEHAATLASVTLTVEHDVTDGENTFWTAIVTRPAACIVPTATPVDDASISVRKNVTGSANEPTGFNIDVSGPTADITNLDENDGYAVRGGLTPGLFVLTEYAIPAGFEFVEWNCTSDQLGADIDEDVGLKNVAIELRAAEDVVCTLTNRVKPTPTATATAVPATPTAQPAATAQPTTKTIPCPDGTTEVVPASYVGSACVGHTTPASSTTVNVLPASSAPAPAAPIAPTPSPSTVGRITAPNTGDGGIADDDAAYLLDPNTHASAWAWLVVGALGAVGVFCLALGVGGYINRKDRTNTV